MLLKSQLLLLLSSRVVSAINPPTASNCAVNVLPTPSVLGASILTIDATESTLDSTSIGFCNVTLTYTHPGQEDLIKVWLALPSAWNGRFQGVGGGGWATGFPSEMVPAISQGYAAVSTDGGHDALGQTTDSWALLSPGNVNLYALQNFASVALNDMTVLGKQLTEAYYGKSISKSYWAGCSTGGRQGLMMAQRYPDAYDGILALAPAVNWAEFIPAMFWPQWVMQQLGYFANQCELDAITAAAISACDELDGLKDGIIGLPGSCAFDPSTVVGQPYTCGNTTGSISTSAAKIATATWTGATDGAGNVQWPGIALGAPLSALAGTTCDPKGKNCTGSPYTISTDWHRLFFQKDPAFDPYNYTQATWDAAFHASVQQFTSIIGTSDADLSEFKSAGGKMITWHGMADQSIPVNGTVDYYDRVLALDANATDFYRLYLAPGVEHCRGGAGAAPTDALGALVSWVEGASISIAENPILLQQHSDTSSLYPSTKTQNRIPSPPTPEEIEVVELPLPPVATTRERGSCSVGINPRRTGCIARDLANQRFQSGDFTSDGRHVVVNVEFVGAPGAPDSASVYDGEQLILIKADGGSFSNGDPWRCLSCGVPVENALGVDPKKDYPHVFRSGTKAIWGHNIVDCDGEQLSSESCTPERIHIYPIHWPGTNSTPRELRVHPDNNHIGWSSFTTGGQFAYFGRLAFNTAPTDSGPPVPRYDLVDVNLLVDPTRATPISTNGTRLTIHHDAITVGELRGFSGSGDEITYIGYPTESTNIDLYAVHVETGVVRRLTSHPEYADPMAFSADDQWFVTMDTRGSERQMWMAGLRGVPPLVDLVAVMAAASTRNNGVRRFFQPILIDRYGDRGEYFGQQVNAAGDKSNGAVNDPNWNGRADPAFSLDGTKIVYWQALVSAPACGGENPLVCPESTAQGGREYRVMLARLKSREPTPPKEVYKVPDYLLWATPFKPGFSPPSPLTIPPGNYTLAGKISGHANVRLFGEAPTNRIAVNYTDYADSGEHVLNGYEDVTVTTTPPNLWENKLDWYSDIVQTKAGEVTGKKVTSPGGFHLRIDAMRNFFEANGTLTTIVGGKRYEQPANGA
ncbi:hypothetical protein N0V95_002312 [Ascochyta clinopodiicola]|nr:hypothetical protein N0V95_002312 [Ascochyta clinopodiicola]